MSKLTLPALIFLSLSIIFTVTAQLFVKSGMLECGANPSQAKLLPQFMLRVACNPRIWLWFLCAVVGQICWAMTLARVPLSVAMPFTALNIVGVVALSPLVFGHSEAVPWSRWVGVLIVCLGIWLAAQK